LFVGLFFYSAPESGVKAEIFFHKTKTQSSRDDGDKTAQPTVDSILKWQSPVFRQKRRRCRNRREVGFHRETIMRQRAGLPSPTNVWF
jgi:hypothetical protein